MGLTLRTLKGSRLTHEELDDNFRHFTGSHTVDGTVTATGFVGDGSGLTGVTAAADLTGTGVVSGSVQLDGGRFGFGADIEATGSFTGSFIGDGSGLTGVTAAADLTGTNVISGSDFEYNTVDAKWSVGKRVELSNGLFAAAMPSDPITFRNFSADSTETVVRVLGPNNIYSLVVKGSSTEVGNSLKVGIPAIGGGIVPGTDLVHARIITQGGQAFGHVSASLFSGSFEGDGSGLTGIASDLTGTEVLSGSNWSYTPNNSFAGWNFSGPVSLGGNISNFGFNNSVNGSNIVFGGNYSTGIRFNKSDIQFFSDPNHIWSSQQVMRINGTTGQVSASAFTGSFVGDGSKLTGLPAGNVPVIAGTTLPSVANSVTGSMILIEFTPPGMGALPELGLYIYTGQSSSGWKSITLN